MRLFTAIDLSSEVRLRVHALVESLRPLANLRWSPTENLHITTRFIGEWPEAQLPELERGLGAIPKTGAFSVRIRGLGWFPNPHRPRVFWAGVDAPAALGTLAAVTSKAVESVGAPGDDREYSPHLTLARTRESTSKEVLNAVRQAAAALTWDDFGSFEATSQILYLSAGGKYTKLSQYSLV